jgi:tRNA-2-methylthio-N6-dimethylallyladenosine synthase
MKYYFWILGCAMNYSDAERVSAVLDGFGFEKTEKEKEANIFIVIACSVRQHAIDRIYGKVKEWKEKPDLTTILSGCVLETDKKKLSQQFDLIFEIKDINHLSDFISNKFNLQKKAESFGDYLSIIPSYNSKVRAYVPISTGCNNFCTYCAVPYTRGREKSRSREEIIVEVKNIVGKGIKEITLLGQNVNSYGQDLGKNKNNDAFIELIKKIDKIPGNYRIYFYSNHPKDMSKELIKTLSTLKHFPHYIHLPLQSGNDQVIGAMNRHHTQKQYLNLVKEINEAMPDITLTTDIIVGFPGETEKQFEDTVKVMKKAKYDMAFIAQFSSRPGTKAASMDDNVSNEEKRRREDILQKILAETALEKNKKLVGSIQNILIDEEKKDKMYGRTASYKVVEIKKSPTIKIGDFVKVKIDSVTAWKLKGSKA